jgi:opacity protein-like surface antigen
MRKVIFLTVSIIGLGAALHAHAEDRSGFYVGGSLGQATNESGEFKGSDFAFKLSGGYAFNRYLGLEVAYIDAGTQDDTIGLVDVETESSGVITSALFRLPFGETFALFGKVGYVFYDSETTARVDSVSEHDSNSDEDLTYGIGLDVAVSGGLKFRAEYEAVDVSDGDFRIVSAGVVYKFR